MNSTRKIEQLVINGALYAFLTNANIGVNDKPISVSSISTDPVLADKVYNLVIGCIDAMKYPHHGPNLDWYSVGYGMAIASTLQVRYDSNGMLVLD